MPRTMKKRASPYKKRRVARRRVVRRNANQPEWASMSETIDYGNLLIGSYYNLNDVQLAQFPRAATVAGAYAQFRITKLTWKCQPLLDTFSSGGATQIPYLHWVINKTGQDFPGLTQDWFLANGAKPVRFDDKTVTIGYAPAVVYDVIEAGTPATTEQPNASKTMQWLATNKDSFVPGVFTASQVSHTGHHLLVTSPGSSQPMAFRMTLTAEFQFKKPSAPAPSSSDVGYVLKSEIHL